MEILIHTKKNFDEENLLALSYMHKLKILYFIKESLSVLKRVHSNSLIHFAHKSQ